MNPKNYTNLDPKLREAYDRVMNAVISPVSEPAQSTTVVSNQTFTPGPQTPKPPSTPPPAPLVNPVVQKQAQMTAGTITGVSISQHKSGILPIVIILGGIIFFAVYAFFWLKFFQIQLPFLSNFF